MGYVLIQPRPPYPPPPVNSSSSVTAAASSTPDKQYKCQECGHTTRSSVGMYYHQNQHRGIYPYYCPYCNKGHTGTSHLRGHLRTNHRIQEPLRCAYCSVIVAKIVDYVKHVRACPQRPLVEDSNGQGPDGSGNSDTNVNSAV